MSVEPSTTSNPSAAGDASNAEAEAFRSGALAGWNRAWAEYYTASFADAQPRQPVLDTSEEAAPAFELSDEWAAFFARGAARRKKAREQEAEDARAEEADDREREEEAVPLFLGGARDAASRTRAERLYGKRAEEVLLAEARIDARFQAEIASHRAAVWPALPLTAWQPRKERRKAAGKPRQQAAVSDSDDDRSLSGAEDAVYGVPSAFGGTRARRPRKRPRRSPKEDELLKETRARGESTADVPGGWEKHTTGVGSKILAKMGFTGTLGARGGGIAEPLLPQKKENRGEGLGKKTKEEKIEHERRMREKKDREKAKEVAAKPAVTRWKKKGKGERFYSIEGDDTRKQSSAPLKERVIDMRDGEAREVGSVAEALLQQKTPAVTKGNAFAAPEFRHNVQLLLDAARVETESAMRALETEKLIGDNAQREQQRLLVEIRELEEKKATSMSLEHELRRVKNAKTAVEFASLVESKCATLFAECKSPSPRFMLPDVLVQLAEPHLRACFRSGLSAPEAAASVHGGTVARLLHALKSPLSTPDSGHFLRLCSRTILRELRLHPLDVKNDASLPALMSAFSAAVHPAVLGTFTDDILVPALEASLRGVRADNPPHVWMHVWLPVVGASALEPLFPALRARISRALMSWDPASGPAGTEQAQRELRAWGAILPRRKLHAVVARAVLPILGRHVDAAPPTERAALAAAAVGAWGDVAPARPLAETLVPLLWCAVERARGTLLPHTRDSSRTARAAEDYREWAAAFGPLKKYVRHVLAAFLFVLAADKRSEGNAPLRERLAKADVRVLGRNAYRRPERRAPTAPERRTGVGERASLADAVAALAQKKGLALLPDGRDRDGRKVFRLGGVRVVLDGARRLVLRVRAGEGEKGQRLEPIALADLMDAAAGATE